MKVILRRCDNQIFMTLIAISAILKFKVLENNGQFGSGFLIVILKYWMYFLKRCIKVNRIHKY